MIEEAYVPTTPEERRVCLLTLAQVMGKLSVVTDTSALWPECVLALDFAYSRVQHVVGELFAVVEESYPEN